MTFFRKLKKPRYWLSIVVILVVAWVVFSPDSGPDFESEMVSRTDVSEVISGTGTVSTSQDVNLSFEIQGVVDSVHVSEGNHVGRGIILASLRSDSLQDDVDSARANLLSQEAQLQEMIAGVSSAEEASAKAALESARLDLLTNDIQAYFTGQQIEDGSLSYTPPTISGTYAGEEMGEYVVTLYRSSTQSGYSFRYSGLESGVGEASSESPQPLGTKGLYIQFPDNFARGSSVEWTVEIPNTRSSQYTTKKSAYDKALADYNLAVEGHREEQIDSQEALVEQARANYNKSLNSLSKANLTSPIAGIVTSIDMEVGETVSPGQTVMSLISDNDYKVTLWVSESDIANLSIGDTAEVDFIAFPNEIFEAEVIYISPSAEIRDGVTSFKVELSFLDADKRIKPGMTADIDVLTEKVEGAISIPGRAISRVDGRNIVRVIEDGAVEERIVETGIQGYNGRVEVISGLEEGDEVITFIREEDLQVLTNNDS